KQAINTGTGRIAKTRPTASGTGPSRQPRKPTIPMVAIAQTVISRASQAARHTERDVLGWAIPGPGIPGGGLAGADPYGAGPYGGGGGSGAPMRLTVVGPSAAYGPSRLAESTTRSARPSTTPVARSRSTTAPRSRATTTLPEKPTPPR